MASIENRSRIRVTVKNRDDLTKAFTYTANLAIQDYLQELRSQGFKPKLSSENNCYAVRVRQIGYPDQCIFAASEHEAIEIKQRIEAERKRGIFTDYSTAWQTTFADLLIRYLHEESPRHKTFVIEGYKINSLLQDAGLPRQDLGAILAAHKNPNPKLAGKKMPTPKGYRVSEPSEAGMFIRKPFAALVPEDFQDYADERRQVVENSTIDREFDLFSAVCHKAIDGWRIPVAKSPMDGVTRPDYFNERERRLQAMEEEKLLQAAFEEDKERSIGLCLERLMGSERKASSAAGTTYSRKKIVKDARKKYREEATRAYDHVALYETFIQFQLMTGARRSEALGLTWSNLDLDMQTAFLPETKNGRSRKLPIRRDLVKLLRQLPRDNALVFPIGLDALRNAWQRMCEKAGLIDDKLLRIHDLRHEAISRVAEAGSNTPGGFSLIDLQAFSGHRDTRMLLRYAHLCAQGLAERLDAAFSNDSQVTFHHGQRRLKKHASISMSELANVAPAHTVPSYNMQLTPQQINWSFKALPLGPAHKNGQDGDTGNQRGHQEQPAPAGKVLSGNVIPVDFARKVAA